LGTYSDDESSEDEQHKHRLEQHGQKSVGSSMSDGGAPVLSAKEEALAHKSRKKAFVKSLGEHRKYQRSHSQWKSEKTGEATKSRGVYGLKKQRDEYNEEMEELMQVQEQLARRNKPRWDRHIYTNNAIGSGKLNNQIEFGESLL
jgi:hypothetical protein